MNKIVFWALCLVNINTASALDTSSLPYWDIDFKKIQCAGHRGSDVIFDGSQSTWIRSSQLTVLMQDAAMKSSYKVKIQSAVYVDSDGDMVFLGTRGSSDEVVLNRFTFINISGNVSLFLLAQHQAQVFDDLSGWDAVSYTCLLN